MREKKISVDQKKRTVDELEKITHSETRKIEDLSAPKEREALEVKCAALKRLTTCIGIPARR